MIGLDIGIKVKIFGLGLEVHGLGHAARGLGLGFELET